MIFISLVLYDCRLNKELKIKKNDFKVVKQHKRENKSIEKREKIECSYVLKEIHRLKTVEIDEMSVEKNNTNHSVKFKLRYIKPLEEFIRDEEIKNFFVKNKNFIIESVILKENKVIISIKCVLG